jgi:hypothetical protein
MVAFDKHKGAKGELIACAWLLSEGYEVFRNVSPFGIIDVVAIKDNKISYFDVSTRPKLPTEAQIEAGVRIICVNDDGNCEICEFTSMSLRNSIKLTKTCDQCGNSYKPHRYRQRFCTKQCNHMFHNKKFKDKFMYMTKVPATEIEAV